MLIFPLALLFQWICAIYQYSCAKMVKVSKSVRRKLIPYRSYIGSGAFRKIKYFGDIPGQLFCVLGFDHKVKVAQKHFCCLFFSQYISYS